jgi:predicted peptidase
MTLPLFTARVALLALLLFGLAGVLHANPAETGFLNREVNLNGETYRYQVYVPQNWTKQQKWPVVLFLHGAGERGDDGLVQTDVGIGTAIRKNASRFPAIVVMPQCRKDIWWPAEQMQAQALQALEQSIKEFNGDRERVYLTGLSMGGYGTLAIAAKKTGKFAAYVAICGGVAHPSRKDLSVGAPEGSDPYAFVAKQIASTPMWLFHGGADPVVPTDESRKLHEALKAAGGNVKYTEYPNVGHNSWDKAYAEPELMKWLLEQRLSGAK